MPVDHSTSASSASPALTLLAAVLSILLSGGIGVAQLLWRRKIDSDKAKADAARERRREQRAARVERRKEERARKEAREREAREQLVAQERERTAREQQERDRFERRLVLLEEKAHEQDIVGARQAERLDRIDESLGEIKSMLRAVIGGSSPQLDPPPPMPRPRTQR
jgi:hypothetical protein